MAKTGKIIHEWRPFQNGDRYRLIVTAESVGEDVTDWSRFLRVEMCQTDLLGAESWRGGPFRGDVVQDALKIALFNLLTTSDG